ncbi:MAG: FG-GAP repeat domain-containing protein, partial [Verrucomicrobiota bacterium]
MAYNASPAVTLHVASPALMPFSLPSFLGSTVGTAFESLAGDFNGDHQVDMVTSGVSGNSLAFYQGTAGGAFLSEQLLNGGLDLIARGLAGVDYDGDGDLDLITSEANKATSQGAANEGTITLYRNDGTGRFSRVVLKSGLKSGQSVGAGDFNVDGRADVAWTTFGFDFATFTIDAAFNYALQSGNGELGATTMLSSNYGGLQVNDVNGDGKLDIIAVEKNLTPEFVEAYALRVHAGNGDGTFSTPQLISTNELTTIRQIVDLNSDGRLDILITDQASDSRTGYYPQQADGSFGSRIDLLSGIVRTGAAIRAVDLNKDGVLDIVAAVPGGAFGSGVQPTIQWVPGLGEGAYGASILIAHHNVSVYNVEVLDLDGDSHLDILAAGNSTPAIPGTVVVYLNKTGENPILVVPPPAFTRIGGDPIDVRVYFGVPITVNGTPRVALDVGGNTVLADYFGGSGTPTLTFRYSVALTELDLDGVQLAKNAIDLNGGMLADPFGGPVALEFPNSPFTGVVVNGRGPLVQMISRMEATPTVSGAVRFAVQLTETVSGVDASDFSARSTEGDLTGAAVVSVTGSGSLYEVTVSTGMGTGALGLTVLGTATIQDT